jgi:hypothetical protein
MAITKTIEIDVNSLKAVGGLDNLDKALKKVDKSAKSVDATFEEVYGDLQPLTSRMGEAEDRLYELALAGQSATKEYQDLLQTVGNYRRVQMQTDMVVDAAATTFDAKLGGALQGVTSTFAGVQGAMALTGGESEKLEEALLKVQGAMALAEGVRGIREGAVAFKALGVSAKIALNGIKTGIAATGVGVLLIALGALVAYWDDIKSAVSGVSDEQEKLNEQSQANLDVQQKKLDSISGQENLLKLQGKSEKEILNLKLKQTDEVIKASELQIENNIATTKAQTEAAKRNQEILSGVLKFISLPLTLILKAVDAVGSALGKDFGLEDKVFNGLASLVFDPEEVKAEGDKVVEEQKNALAKLKNDRAGLQLSLKNIDAQANKDAAAKQKEANDKAIELAKQKAEALERIRQGEIDTEAERRAEELKKVQDEYATLIAEAIKFGQDTTALKEAQLTKERELTDRFKKEDQEKEDAYWNAEAEKAIERDENAKKKREEQAAEEIAFQKAKDDAIASSKENLTNIVAGLEETGLAKTKAGQGLSKAIALTQIGIDSAVAISKASTLANAEGVAAQLAFPTVPGIGTAARIFSYASTALSVASNIARAKKLLSSGGSSSGGSAGGGGGSSAPNGGAAPAPSFNVVGNSGTNQIAQTLGNQQPVQAYVVANNVTTQQSLDRNIVNNASLG